MISEIINGKLQLKRNHSYYHQIQGQLYITNQICCDLVIWTLKDFQIIRILRDSSWEPNLEILIDFYYSHFLPSLN